VSDPLYLSGDVLTVWDPRNPLPAWAIRAGGWLRGRRARADHVVMFHHADAAGTAWGIEGRPGGVGWVDLATYPHITSSNAAQPKTDAQRAQLREAAVGMLDVGYDWAAVVSDARQALHLDHLWRSKDFGDDAPAHVVCSSAWDWVYEHLGLASPGGTVGTRWTTPADWERFNLAAGWA
jgi:hypothetical protein